LGCEIAVLLLVAAVMAFVLFALVLCFFFEIAVAVFVFL
jgi:hypothetical protein